MMRFSPVFKSSTHCLPSPDGNLIATLLTSSISIRSVESLDIIRTIRLPPDLPGGVTTFVWSTSSARILLASADEIHVFSVTEGNLHATIRNLTSSVAKSDFVDFGATDGEAYVCSAHGIKLSLLDLSSSKVVEIDNPKFYTAVSAARGYSFRPRTHHLALLTRSAGKDTISIHAPGSREVQRSWSPDLIDTQGLSWTPDGRWLVVWESASQGHRVVFFTPDGHKYRDWWGPLQSATGDINDRLSAGIKLLVFSPDSHFTAIGDFSRCVLVSRTSNLTDQLRLDHPSHVEPSDTMQIWQERIDMSSANAPVPSFVKASQTLSPPSRTSGSVSDLRSGPHTVLFDCSSALLAVILDDAPSTLWIWDVSVSELRAVLMFHSEISRVDWHPTQAELLFVECEGTSYHNIIFVWDPLSLGPRTIDFRSLLPKGGPAGMSAKSSTFWLKSELGPGSLFFTDSRAYLLASLADAHEDLPWKQDQRLRPAKPALDVEPSLDGDGDASDIDEDVSHVDDTFHFKRNVHA